jgi:ribosomal protein S18 acetylase RimI-like enzyme
MMSDLAISPMAPENRELAATLLSSMDPWLTLGMSRETLLSRVSSPQRKVYQMMDCSTLIGVLVINPDAGPLTGYIQVLAVAEGYRSRGVGKLLLDHAENVIFHELGCKNVFLCASSFNHGAQKFYEREGYERFGLLKDYLRKGMDEVMFRKSKGPLLE